MQIGLVGQSWYNGGDFSGERDGVLREDDYGRAGIAREIRRW